MREAAAEIGARVLRDLEESGHRLGLEVMREYPVVGGRIDLVWLWRGPASFPSALPLVAFEVESSWRTRKHIKGDLLNLLDLQPALGVIVLLGEGPDVESTRRFAQQMVDRRPVRVEIWSPDDVRELATGEPRQIVALVPSAAPSEEDLQDGPSVRHAGKYRRLAQRLSAEPDNRLEITFGEIEETLGFPLPPSSRKHPAHWSSYEGSAVVRAVHDAGWRARNVDLKRERVVFERWTQ